MTRPNLHALARAVLGAALLAGPQLAFAEEARPPQLRDVGIDQRLGDPAPLDLTFTDESGAPVKLADFFGKRPVILTLAYYECPMLCTLVLNGLASSLGVLTLEPGRDFDIVTVSINPKETPALAAAKKREYLARYKRAGAEAGWHFLTGRQESIQTLARAVGFRYTFDPETGRYAHASGVMVLTPEGKLSRYFYGVEYAPKDLRLALVEASSGRIGSFVDQVLLFCYDYDPATGKYGAVAYRLVRTGGVLTVLLLGAYIGVMWRREARRSRASSV